MSTKAGSPVKLLLLALAVCASASITAAQSYEPPGTYIWQAPAASFTVESSTQTYGTDDQSGSRYATGPADALTVLTTGLNVPNGAVIDRVTFEVYDLDDTQDIEAQLLFCGDTLQGQPGGTCTIAWDQQTTGMTGWQWLTAGLGGVIDNSAGFFRIRVLLKPGSSPTSVMFRRAMFSYHLAVSQSGPAFNDVPPTSPYYQFVNALAASGITSGCGGGNYCPDSPVTRAQMAVFITKALGLYWPVTVFQNP